ncbi:inovirus-type Gp2 protein [Escherichia coli]|uniref:inovirus-type Gp2 protein n=1 Tax=Escherichia coli TaxID=562 RepID=UPI001907E914|nr:inovirus-type Gp2 protein [Escherichia coli]MBK1849522.1 inovirus-type Gp2 protein [Escherichia coli]
MPKSYTPNWFFTALLDNHINQMMARYSCLRALRMDFFYRKDTPDFLQPDHRWLELQLRMLLEQVEQFENIVGFFWVIEWTADHGFHANVVFWIDRQRVKKIYPFAERIAECWQAITYNCGSAHRCTYQPHYAYNINIPVRHNDPESIDNIRGALHYLAKEEQKDGLCAYGCNEVPERPAAGRPRKPHF